MSTNPQSPVTQPRIWKYGLGALITLLVLIPAVAILDASYIHTSHQSTRSDTNMDIVRWIALPSMFVVTIFGVHWFSASHAANEREREWRKQTDLVRKQEELARTEQGRREYVLEVIGLGVTVEKYRQGALWAALQNGDPYASLREQDPRKYEWSADDKGGVGGARLYDAMENGVNMIPVYWGTPSFYAGVPWEDPASQPSAINPAPGLVGGGESNGLPEHVFVVAPWKLDERPDRLLDDVFAFFDAHPDVPYVALSADDGVTRRDLRRPYGAPRRHKDGYYIPEMPDAGAFFILARRERIEPLRPFVFDDVDENTASIETLNGKGFGRRLYLKHLALQQSVQMPISEDKYDQMDRRLPVVAEWLPAAAAFANEPDIRGVGVGAAIDDYNPWAHRPPKDWRPTPWFPIPWSKFQMDAFDRLPSFGFIHRPTFIRFDDAEGKPITRRDQRKKIMLAGWQQALLSLPEAERAKGPARIITAYADKTEQEILLTTTMMDYTAAGGPDFDSATGVHVINTDRRLGNTGAATFFVQMAIGVMGSYKAGGSSAAINLRDPHEASVIFITPPSEEKRKAQEQTHGDILRNRVGPSIDPDSYKTPSVESIIGADARAAQAAKAGAK
ncbi:MAG: DUF2875 family protein [Pseudomonadota bacterium]